MEDHTVTTDTTDRIIIHLADPLPPRLSNLPLGASSPALTRSLLEVDAEMTVYPIVGTMTPMMDLYPHGRTGSIGQNHWKSLQGAL